MILPVPGDSQRARSASGTMRSMVEGQVRRCMTSLGQGMRHVPLYQLRWSPSPKGEDFV